LASSFLPSVDVLRSDDLVNLRFEFVNMTLGVGADLPNPPPPQLIGVVGQPAFIIVDFPSQHIVESVLASAINPPAPPYPARVSGPSRLTFAVPASRLPIPYGLQSVLTLLTSLTPLMQSEVPDGVGATAIECPYGLVLAPAAGSPARFFHRPDPAASIRSGWIELWHTRLGTLQGDATMRGTSLPPLQAVTSLPADRTFPVSLNDAARRNIVAQSDNNPGRIFAEKFSLSALGASIRVRSDWPPPSPSSGITLKAWQHEANLARDDYVRIEKHGFLFPFGHRATLTTITERNFDTLPQFAVLLERSFVTVRELERNYDNETPNYPHAGREMPLKRLHIAAPLQQPAPVEVLPAIEFSVVAKDSTSADITFQLPMIFAEAGTSFNDMGAAYKSHNVAKLGSQLVAIADDRQGSGDSRMKVANMYFGAVPAPGVGPGLPPFLPVVLQADVAIPAVDSFSAAAARPTTVRRGAEAALHRSSSRLNARSLSTGQAAGAGASQPLTVTIVHNAQYLAAGFQADDTTQVFAAITSPLQSLSTPPARAGGLCAPTLPAFDTISPTVGPTVSAAGNADPVQIIGQTKLFGTIPLQSVLAPLGALPKELASPQSLVQLFDKIDLPENNDNVPRPLLSTVAIPTQSGERAGSVGAAAPSVDAIETRFVWKPPVKAADLPPPLAPIRDKSIVLVCKGRTRTPLIPATAAGAAPSFDVVGTLRHFALKIAGLIEIQFNHVTFTSGSGRKAAIDPDISAIIFDGPLTFVNALSQLLPQGLSVGPAASLRPAVTVASSQLRGRAMIADQPDGVVIRFDQAIPVFAIGILSIQNVAFRSSLSLPFVEGTPMALRFGLSERAHPFLVTVGPFGGGGFFALEVRTDNAHALLVEASIEFGANVAFDVGVASGGVYLLAGIYYSRLEGNDVQLTGYLRCGGYLEVLGIVGISVEFYLALEWKGQSLEGCAALSISVKVGFFSFSTTVSVHKRIASFGSLPGDPARFVRLAAGPPPPPTFEDVVSLDQWKQYCRAFA
jgi:hypothetical protein